MTDVIKDIIRTLNESLRKMSESIINSIASIH